MKHNIQPGYNCCNHIVTGFSSARTLRQFGTNLTLFTIQTDAACVWRVLVHVFV